MVKFVIDIKQWLSNAVVLECAPKDGDMYANMQGVRYVLGNVQNVISYSQKEVFFVITMKENVPELVKFLSEAKVPSGSYSTPQDEPNILIKRVFTINKNESLDIKIFYISLQNTIIYFCEDNFAEIGGDRGTFSKDDFNYLWKASAVFDPNTLLVPAVEMKVERSPKFDNELCRFEMKPLFMKKSPLELCDEIKVGQKVYTIPFLTEGKILSTFVKNTPNEVEQYNDAVGRWKQRWGIRRPDFKDCESHTFVNTEFSDERYDDKTYHISCLLSELPVECESEKDEPNALCLEFIDMFKDCLNRIGNLPIIAELA